jgi:hypothetical protein
MPLPADYNGGGSAWPINLSNLGPAADRTLTPRPALAGLYKQSFVAPAAAALDSFIDTAVAGPDTATDTYVPGDAAMDGALGATGIIPQARNVVITVTHDTSVVALSGVITGKDQYGKTITEAWSVTATGTTKTFTGAVAFKSIDSITVVAAADASADDIQIGTGKVFGLAFKNPMPGVVKELHAGSILTNGVVVAASASANADARGTYTPNGTPNGVLTWDIWYIVDDFNDLD